LCVHCNEEIFPCAVCDDECDWDKANWGCHRFEHSNEYIIKHRESTGIKDINGVVIRDGDIANMTYVSVFGDKKIIGKVIWNESHRDFVFRSKLADRFINTCSLEVTGNIFENPDLLKNEQEVEA
jgi:hypothetical protein